MVLSESKRCFPDQTKTPRKNTASRVHDPQAKRNFTRRTPRRTEASQARKAHAPGAGHGHRRRGPPDIRSSPSPLAPSIPLPPFPSALTLARLTRLAALLRSYHHLHYINPRSPRAHAPTRRPTRRNRATQTHTRRCLRRRAAPARSFSTQVQSGYGRRGLRRRTVLAQAERGRRGARDRG